MLSSGGPAVRYVHVLLCALVLSTRSCAAGTDANSTNVAVEEEEDDSFPDITLEEFKERYRRLIPYMTFFVANNYVNGQAQVPQATSANEAQSGALARTPAQLYARINPVPRRGNDHRGSVQSQEKKFNPSVRFDPRNVAADNEYFTPVGYSSKVNYDEYQPPYRLYREQEPAYPEITTVPSQIPRNENNVYRANVRPLRPYATNGRDHHHPPLRKQPAAKPNHVNLRDEYALDYNVGPSGAIWPDRFLKDFQTSRYLPPHAYANILDAVPGKQQSPAIAHPQRNPNVNLQQIAESFHLTERLPETLNDDNLGNSLKTLVEILNILHSAKNEEFPPVQPSALTPPAQPRLPQKATNYKARPRNRPKVVTESRFQATPNPLYLTDDPERYEIASHEDETRSNARPQPGYNANSLSNEKLVEYYVPVVHDIPAKDKEPFLPTVRPQANEGPTDHSYAITEDLGDDVPQEQSFALPSAIPKSPVYGYAKPGPVSTTQHTVPQTSLKYGATRGEANVDYPAYSVIPQTNFSCKEQRYKGFFGDPDTGCQVWHYCDLNGGKSSFLCPNGTIFSQVALTCDWWFNVKCEITTQLYVLNERLYKYILPIMPKFPEDFSGPEVDRYLELKFKEMEAKLKEKKLKKQKEEKEKEKLKDKQQSQQKSE